MKRRTNNFSYLKIRNRKWRNEIIAMLCLTLDKSDNDLIEECDYYIEQNKELKKFILKMKEKNVLTSLDDELLSIKFSLSEYSYNNLCYYICVLVQEGTISMDELNKLTNVIKKCADESEDNFYEDSKRLEEVISVVAESLKDELSRKILIDEFEERINDLSKDYPESKFALDYIYKRALFTYDIIV